MGALLWGHLKLGVEMKKHMIAGGGGLKLHVLEAGNPTGPCILFIHGFTQSAYAWQRQFTGSLAQSHRILALDIRGHGESEKPLESDHYTNSDLWADDIHAVLTALDVKKCVLVGWSYGGFIICDYLRKYQEQNIEGLVFVGAATKMGTAEAMALLGPNLTKHIPAFFSNDTRTTIDTLTQFVSDCFVHPPKQSELYTILGYNHSVPPDVRVGLFSREIDNDAILEKVSVPTLLIHGVKDKVVLPSSSEHIGKKIPHAKLSLFKESAHCPFSEEAESFNIEVRALLT
jgi:non-heme chloroperoxidase